MDNIQKINLDFNPKGSIPLVCEKQGDTGRFIEAYIYNNGKRVTLTSSMSCQLRAKRPSQYSNIISAQVNYTNNYVYITLSQSLLSEAGRVLCALWLYDNNIHLATINFIIDVDANPTVNENVYTSDEFYALNQMVMDGKNLVEDSEAYSVGTRNGVPVGSDDPAYHNNAKYYSQQASSQVHAVTYQPNQGLTDEQKANARENINAFEIPADIDDNTFLFYNDEEKWIGQKAIIPPVATSADDGKYLKYDADEDIWVVGNKLVPMPTIPQGIGDNSYGLTYSVVGGFQLQDCTQNLSSTEINAILAEVFD